MKLVAIDFETADYGADSACALGVVTIERGRIAERGYRLIRPPRKNFVFSYIHGITWRDVKAAPAFGEVWESMRDLWQGADYFVAHNAGFDRKVLAACCAAEGLAAPAAPFICTVQVARKQWNCRPANLAAVCERLGIALKHHDAASDAHACAAIAVQAHAEGFALASATLGAGRRAA
jgi:DNA polymerase-3 subunit epsilon